MMDEGDKSRLSTFLIAQYQQKFPGHLEALAMDDSLE